MTWFGIQEEGGNRQRVRTYKGDSGYQRPNVVTISRGSCNVDGILDAVLRGHL